MQNVRRFHLLAGLAIVSVVSCSPNDVTPTAAVASASGRCGIELTESHERPRGRLQYADGKDSFVLESDVDAAGTTAFTVKARIDGRDAFVANGSRAADGSTITVLKYEAALVGGRGLEIVLRSADGVTFGGSIDGKTLRAFSAQGLQNGADALAFADGTSVDIGLVPEPAAKAVSRLFAAVGSRSGDGCSPAQPSLGTKGVPGRTDDLSGQCDACKGVCNAEYILCVSGVAVGAVGLAMIPVVGPALAIAFTVAGNYYCATKARDCRVLCTAIGGSCCPVKCGGSCCFAGEECLDSTSGLCCPGSFKACPGPKASCFDPTNEKCLETGESCRFKDGCGGTTCCNAFSEICVSSSAGLCCPTATSTPCAGSLCCPGLNTCINGACCAPERACGAAGCCASGLVCLGGTCTTPTVCPSGTVRSVDPDGVEACCAPGVVSCKGSCCAASQNFCCFSGCSAVSCIK